jgi:serine/threonine-protein kinase HipA
MTTQSMIQIHRQGEWINAAKLVQLGSGRCRLEYEQDYIFSTDPLPLSLNLPVQFTDLAYIQPAGGALEVLNFDLPPFLFDLVPQGRGRALLTRELRLADGDGIELALLMAGAFNPIGCLRLTSAVAFYRSFVDREDTGRGWGSGVELEDIVNHSEGFLHQLSLHALLASGTTGAQGAAPKFLLTQDREGLWFPDMALDDAQAAQHWLVKLPRGRKDEDRLVLRNEAAYLRVAQACGLRLHAAPELHNEMLFVRRFDRQVDEHGQVCRLHQESLASLAKLKGFAPATSHNELLQALRSHVTDPATETIEYLKREALNQALRNTDNHARNTAVQRCPDGRIQLTPVFDFAPMYKDPEMIPRAVHWTDHEGLRVESWPAIMDAVAWKPGERESAARALYVFADTVARLPETARDCGVEGVVINECRGAIDRVAASLDRITSG